MLLLLWLLLQPLLLLSFLLASAHFACAWGHRHRHRPHNLRHIGQHVMRATRHGSHHSNSQCHSQWTRLDGPKESNRKERKKGKQGKCWPYARRQLMPRKMPKIVALVGPKSKRKENGNTKTGRKCWQEREEEEEDGEGLDSGRKSIHVEEARATAIKNEIFAQRYVYGVWRAQ